MGKESDTYTVGYMTPLLHTHVCTYVYIYRPWRESGMRFYRDRVNIIAFFHQPASAEGFQQHECRCQCQDEDFVCVCVCV